MIRLGLRSGDWPVIMREFGSRGETVTEKGTNLISRLLEVLF